MAAELGLDATGIDFSPKAIRLAENKARGRSLDAHFLVVNAFELESRAGQYDTVLDCGLFHVFDDRDRRALSEALVRSLCLVVATTCSVLATNSPATGDHGESVRPRLSRASPIPGRARQSLTPNHARQASRPVTFTG
jgi:SAM-dependent methyltransferase